MDVTVRQSDKPLRAALVEFDGPNGTGNVIPAVGVSSFSSSDPTVATVDALTGALAYQKAGVTVITGTNPGNGISASGTLTVIPGLAISAQLQFVSAA